MVANKNKILKTGIALSFEANLCDINSILLQISCIGGIKHLSVMSMNVTGLDRKV